MSGSEGRGHPVASPQGKAPRTYLLVIANIFAAAYLDAWFIFSNFEDIGLDAAAEMFTLLSASARSRVHFARVEAERNMSELLEQVAVGQPDVTPHRGMRYRGRVLAWHRKGAQIDHRAKPAEVRGLRQALKRQSQCVEVVPKSVGGRRAL